MTLHRPNIIIRKITPAEAEEGVICTAAVDKAGRLSICYRPAHWVIEVQGEGWNGTAACELEGHALAEADVEAHLLGYVDAQTLILEGTDWHNEDRSERYGDAV